MNRIDQEPLHSPSLRLLRAPNCSLWLICMLLHEAASYNENTSQRITVLNWDIQSRCFPVPVSSTRQNEMTQKNLMMSTHGFILTVTVCFSVFEILHWGPAEKMNNEKSS